MKLDIYNGFYQNPSLPVSNQECLNCFVAPSELPGLSDKIIKGSPGITLLTTTAETDEESNRGATLMNDIPYFVNGTTIYKLELSTSMDGVETWTATDLGTIGGTGPVSISNNGTQVMVLRPGNAGYIYNSSTEVFSQITDSDFTANGNPLQVFYVDGYFACVTDEKKMIVSSLNDGTTWSALDFGSAESDPDALTAGAVLSNQVYLLGTQTTEGQTNVGGAGFPFQRSGLFLDKGCIAQFSVINLSDTFFMIGAGPNETPSAWQFTGNSYKRIAHDGIEKILGDMSDMEIDDITGFAYTQDGLFFVGWHLTNMTIVYELKTGLWHRRRSYIDEYVNRWRVSNPMYAFGRLIVFDAFSGKIGELETNVYYEYDEEILSVFSTMPFSNNGQSFTVPMLELTMESGVGNSNCTNPVVRMAISRNGKTFNFERSRNIGAVGEYNKRIIWRKNGQFKRFSVLRFACSDPVKKVFIKLEAE